jgi:hypothetical protein
MQRVQETCAHCNQVINESEQINEHHPHYVSLGGRGTPTQTLHRSCHVAVHAEDWKAWGRVGGQITAETTKVWSVNLLNVRCHEAYHLERQYYFIHGRRS